MALTNAVYTYPATAPQQPAAAAFRVLVRLLGIFAPHLGEELWERTGGVGLAADAAWPEYEAALATDPTVTLVVQVNGVRRAALEVPRGLSEAQALERALQSERVAHFLNGDKPSRVFYVPDKLINLVP